MGIVTGGSRIVNGRAGGSHPCSTLERGPPGQQHDLSDGEIEEVAQALQQLTVGSGEWAWVELNYRPHAYQACALTT